MAENVIAATKTIAMIADIVEITSILYDKDVTLVGKQRGFDHKTREYFTQSEAVIAKKGTFKDITITTSDGIEHNSNILNGSQLSDVFEKIEI